MRQIKFRVWDKSKKVFHQEWVGINNYGVVVDDRDDMYNLSLHNNAIIQQFTGFFDKNGNEIYDEDIVSINGNNFLVVWQSDGFWCFHDLKNKVTIEPWKITNYCGKENKKNFELVGNRFESENLLGI